MVGIISHSWVENRGSGKLSDFPVVTQLPMAALGLERKEETIFNLQWGRRGARASNTAVHGSSTWQVARWHSPGLTTAGAPSLSMAASTSYCYLLDCGAHCKILGRRLSFETEFEGLPWGAKTPKSQCRVRSVVMQLGPTCRNEELTRRNRGLHAITRTRCNRINNKHLKELWEILPNVSLSSEWVTSQNRSPSLRLPTGVHGGIRRAFYPFTT